MIKSEGIVEQHIHGAFGIDFMKCSVSDILEVAKYLTENGVCAFFPTVMTDDLEIIKERIEIIKEAKQKQDKKSAQIIGIHLEGPFINSLKSGIHETKYIQPLDAEIFKKIEDDIIKIVTLSPELDITGEFIKYLKSKNIKLSLGHSESSNIEGMDQITHLYNAMGTFHHRNPSVIVNALNSNEIYTEIIADSMHVNDEVLKLTFKYRPLEKIILISDALPLAHSSKKEHIFAGQTIYNKNGKLVNSDGTIAGSSMLLIDIIKNLADKKILRIEDAIKCASDNPLKYHNINSNINLYWNSNNIEKIEFI